MKNFPIFGHVPTTKQIFYRQISRLIINLFSLNSGSSFSSEFAQLLDPVKYVPLPDKLGGLNFVAAHGRLFWRASTLFTEEPLVIEWLGSFTESDIYLDIGANVGSYVILAKKLHPNIQVYASELDFNNLYLMYKNLVINNLQKDVLILPFALAEKQRVSQVHYRDLSQGDALQSMDKESSFDTMKTDKAHVFSHLTYALDDLIRDYNLSQPSMIKVDVDGNELAVLEGSSETLRNAQMIYFENSYTDDCDKLSNYLLESGFTILKSCNIYSKTNKSLVTGQNQLYSKNVAPTLSSNA